MHMEAVERTVQNRLQSLDVKTSNGSPGSLLVPRVYKSAMSWFFSSHVYGWPAKVRNQRGPDGKRFLFLFPTKSMNCALPFPPIVIWGQSYCPCKKCVSLLKDFWKCLLKAHHTHTHTLKVVTVTCMFKSKKMLRKSAEFYCTDGCASS